MNPLSRFAPLACALLLACAVAAPARAADSATDSTYAAIPPYAGYVTDLAQVFDDTRRAQLEGFLDQLQKKTGVQFAVLVLPTVAPEEPDAYKVRVFEKWGIGTKGKDDGLLLLVAMQEHQLRFETGYGLEGTLPDAWEARMLRDLAVPRFREGQPADGITAAVLAAAQRIANEKQVTLTWDGRALRYDGSSGNGEGLPGWAIALVLFLIILSAFNTMGRRGLGGVFYGGGWGGGFGGGWGGGGGGGGSFGGFGGGGSGGGGGGASW